jgi:hypothetical protein
MTLLLLAPAWARAQPGPVLRLNPPGDRRAAFEVVGLDPAVAAELARMERTSDRWPALFAVAVVPAGTEPSTPLPPMLGTYKVEAGVLKFQPRFPLEPGLVYRAWFNSGGARAKVIAAEFTLPKPPATPTTRVTAVYPTGDTLPENLLRLYLHFSAPMSRGAAYSKIHLRDAAGKDVNFSFVELAEELWDPSGRRLTLLFSPGRIKTGLKPREELGPILRQGESYTLVIDRDWPDAAGEPLVSAFRKSFRAGPADNTPVDPARWTIEPPDPGTRGALIVTAPEPLDHALFARLLVVSDPEGRIVPGAVDVDAGETRWRFTPDRPWTAGTYGIAVDKDLEDRAGNSVGRPFEVDVFEKIDRQPVVERVNLSFRVGSGSAER